LVKGKGRKVKANKNWLCSDWDHRDPRDGLSDIDTGKYLSELSKLPQNTLQLLEDSNMHIELREVDNRYQVVKITKKRESEYMQSKDRFFIFNDDGKRIPLTEEQFDRYLGIQHNPEDLYEFEDVQLETLGSEATPPLDAWDIIFDATEYLTMANNFIRQWNNNTAENVNDPVKHLEQLADEFIYSADWFPYSSDKRLKGARAKQIAAKILSGKITTKQHLGAEIGSRVIDTRPQKVKEMRAQALKMPLGKPRAKILIYAQKIMDNVHKDRKNDKGRHIDTINDSDRRILWDMWRNERLKRDGSVQLQSWQFEKMYRAKLEKQVIKGQITKEQADTLLVQHMSKLFDKRVTSKVVKEETKMPEWLLNITPQDVITEEHEFQAGDWLPESRFVESTTESMMEPEEDYIVSCLLDDN
jgi:hypothetical protein